MKSNFFSELEAFLAIESVAGNVKENQAAIQFLQKRFESMGFSFSLKGNSEFGQPVLVVERILTSKEVLVLYNHYDVERIKGHEKWNSDPFSLTRKQGRLFARGIADNKAVLFSRLEVIKKRLAEGKMVPNILWLIQGEEEVGGKVAFDVFPREIAGVNARFFLEETGYYREERPMLFHQCDATVNEPEKKRLIASLNESVFYGRAQVESRTLSKFGLCPFLGSLPANAHYVGFGPNDYQARIHQENESMDAELLIDYRNTFSRFLDWIEINS